MTEIDQAVLKKQIREAIRAVREGQFDLVNQFKVDDWVKQQIDALTEEDIDAIVEVYVLLSSFRVSSSGMTLASPMRLSLLLAKQHSIENLTSALTMQHLIQPQEINVDADGARLFFRRGQKAFESERFSQAKNYFQRAVEIWPAYREAWCALGGTCELLGKQDEAAAAFAKASELV